MKVPAYDRAYQASGFGASHLRPIQLTAGQEVKIMNKSKEKLSQVVKPIGFRSRITARFMAIGRRAIYKNVK